jgi:ribosomal protein L40E
MTAIQTPHQTLTAQMFAKTICRRCGGLYEPTGHGFVECQNHQLDNARADDKRNRDRDNERRGILEQINQMDKVGAI